MVHSYNGILLSSKEQRLNAPYGGISEIRRKEVRHKSVHTKAGSLLSAQAKHMQDPEFHLHFLFYFIYSIVFYIIYLNPIHFPVLCIHLLLLHTTPPQIKKN